MRPDFEAFETAVKQFRGNLSKVASAFGVSRNTVGNWTKEDEDFKRVVKDARMRLFDDCLSASEFIALGIAERDKDGNFLGWRERPDGNMLRYLLSTLGRNEGFGESVDVTSGGEKIGVNLFRVLTKEELQGFDKKFDEDF